MKFNKNNGIDLHLLTRKHDHDMILSGKAVYSTAQTVLLRLGEIYTISDAHKKTQKGI